MRDAVQLAQPRKHQVEKLFEAVIELSPGERKRFLDDACGSDVQLRREVETHIAAALETTDTRIKGILGRRSAPAEARTVVSRPRADRNRERTAFPEDEATLPASGTRIGQYEIIRELGRGGMAAVFLARDTKLGRRVAIKFLQSDKGTSTKRLIVEAQATACCTHENIIVIHDVKEHRGVPYMVLEFLDGQPLGALLHHGPLPPFRAVQLLVPVVKALVCAHERKIVHRDLKPDNIFLTATGTVKVLDFGIAKFVLDQQRRELIERSGVIPEGTTSVLRRRVRLTQHGTLIGTLPYMSPEQWRSEAIDHQSDIWAIGIILFRMIAGHHPLAPLRDLELIVTAELDRPMPSARGVGGMPDGLADVIDHCLQKHKHPAHCQCRGSAFPAEAVLAREPSERDQLSRQSVRRTECIPGNRCRSVFRPVARDRHSTHSAARTPARCRRRPVGSRQIIVRARRHRPGPQALG